MHEPGLIFERVSDLIWESFSDDVYDMTEDVEFMIRNFIYNFEKSFPKVIVEVNERKVDAWEIERRGNHHGMYTTITDFNVVLHFNSNEEEAEFIMLKSAGGL
jgi:hypothetical protein